ncbi:hypothetical protein NUACC21_79790 [Scytonema sp. NUACC21]
MASHNAKDPIRREAFILKQLSSLDEWRGSLVHRAIEKYLIPSLQERKLISESDLTEKTITLAKKQFDFSEQQTYKDASFKKKDAGDSFLALREHEYGISIPQIDIDNFYEDIRQCYKFLYSHTKFLRFLLDGDSYIAEPLINFKFNGCTLVAKLDLVMSYSSSKLCIIDWKISRSQTSDYSKQLNFYALAALNKWRSYKVGDLFLVEANLLQGKLVKHFVRGENLLQIEDLIYRSLLDIRALTGDHKYNLDNLDDYEYANSPMSCEYCKFEKMCVRFSS